MTTVDKSSAAFWNRVARRYANMSIRNPAAYEATLDMVLAQLSPKDHVLELGCGTGTTALKLSPSVGQYVACDYSYEMIAIANEKQTAERIDNLGFRVARAGDESLPQGPFDAVLAFNVLHLLTDRHAAFEEVSQRLYPGGLFISKTPCVSGLFRILQPVVAILHAFGKAPQFNFLSTKKLERDLVNAGFEIVEASDSGTHPPRRFIVAKKVNEPLN